MLYDALVLFIFAIIAAAFGFGGIAADTASIAKIYFVIFVVGVPRRKATVCRRTCCIRDEGGPLGFADQAVIPNHPELHSLRAGVVSV